MKIRTRLLLAAAASIAVALLLTIVVLLTHQQVDQAIARGEAADEILEGVSDLNGVASDYAMHGEERARTQWYSTHDSISRLVSAAELGAPISEDLERIEATFTQLVASRDSQAGSEPELAVAEAAEKRLIAQLSLQSQSITNDAAELAAESRSDISNAQQRATFLILALVGALVVITTTAGFVVVHSIGNPIATLTRAVEAIAKGKQEAKVKVTSNDEVGILGRSFNTMTAALSEKEAELRGDIAKRKQAEEALQQRTHELNERVKELNCLYDISKLVEKPGVSLDEILQGTTETIPPSWQYPEVTCARIVLDGQEFKTERFRETPWRQTSDITMHGQRVGTVEICYLEERPEVDEGPFVKEERSLINSIAQRLGEAVERKQAEEEIRSLNEKLERRVVEQERSILELSTPVVKLWEEIVLLPLIGVVDTERAQQMIESLLAAIVRANARVVVLDITGVPSVDTSVAHHLIKSVAAAKMVGAEVIVTGVSPEAAQTLVKLRVDLSSMRTRGSLRAGLAEALSLTGRRVTSL